MKPDERALLALLANRTHGICVRDVVIGSDVPLKRAHYLLMKWAKKGWYQYGISLDLGWLTAEGLRAAAEAKG